MLDTIMALWNQRQKETRHKVGKLGLVFLLLCVSASLLLVVLSGRSAEKSAIHKKEAHPQVLVQPDVTARDFPPPSPTVIPTSTVTITSTATATPTPTAIPATTATASATPTTSIQDPPVPFIQPPDFVQRVVPKERSDP